MNQDELFYKSTMEEERVDGIEKITGRAKYSAEHSLPNMAYGVFVQSRIAKGTIKSMDITKALASDGVIDVIYYENCPAIAGYSTDATNRPKNVSEWRGHKVLHDNIVRFFGQPIALIVADTLENANAAIRLVKAEYDAVAPEIDFDKLRLDESKLKGTNNYKRGEEKKYKQAAVFIEAEYNIPIEVHNPMELHATIAVWEGDDKLTVYDKNQGPRNTQVTLARTFGLPEKNVRVITENVGGAFGSGLRTWANTPAACIAAKKIQRPVKIVLTRPQMFTMIGYRPHSWQKVGIGADNTGILQGISHEGISNTSKYEDFREGLVNVSRYLYACANVDTKYSMLPLDLSTPIWMRGPGEASGCFALESALDELSYKLKIDPIELRIKNFSDLNPESKLPFSANNLKDCYAYGKEKIGWNKRSKTPGLLKENGWQIGYGMAVGVFGAGKGVASVRAVLNNNGTLVLETAISDMGPGTTTSMTRIAAEKMQIPLEKVKFKLGDSSLPPGPSQGGSGTTSTVGSAVLLACETVQNKLKELAIKFAPEFANKTVTDLLVANSLVQLVNDSQIKISVPELLKISEKSNIDITVTSTGKTAQELKFATNSFSVHFVRLAVNPKNGAIKIQQVVATADAGKIINYKTARSQMIGGVVGGVGMAMSEEAKFDTVTGQIINASLHGYHVPLHSEIPPTDVWFVNKPDNNMGELGAKGVGEISLIGVAAAITNALYNATGKRVRSLPITPEKLGFKA